MLSISFEEATLVRRRFNNSGLEATRRLERIGQTFLQGYHAALDDEVPEALALHLDATDRDFCGFAYEGAAMGLALLDHLSPWRRGRLQAFLEWCRLTARIHDSCGGGVGHCASPVAA